MRIYLTHDRGYDFVSELYEPLENSLSTDYDIFFPHKNHADSLNSKDIIANSDVVIAEVSYASTGQGIELGWANADNIQIICFYRSGTKISGALKFICNNFIEYSTKENMIEQLRTELAKLSNV
jgi:hypothetical protein